MYACCHLSLSVQCLWCLRNSLFRRNWGSIQWSQHEIAEVFKASKRNVLTPPHTCYVAFNNTLTSLSLSLLIWIIKIIVVSTWIVLSKRLNEITNQIHPAQYLELSGTQLMFFLASVQIDCKPWGSHRHPLNLTVFADKVKILITQVPSMSIRTRRTF